MALATLADKHECVYLNACVELFSKCCVPIQQRHEEMRKLKLKHTCLLEHGMNPGAVSHLVRIGLKDANLKPDDVDLIHITEFDTHVLFPEHKDPNAFYNTWSPFGLYEEAIESAELAWPASQPVPCPEAERAEQMLVFKNHAGYEVYTDSVTPVISDSGVFEGWKNYQGYVVTHGETETISRFLGNEVICAFVFRTPPDATESLKKWGKEEAPRYVMMEGRHIEKGGDTIGVLIRSPSQKKGWWIGSCQTGALAQKLVSPIQNGATVTVAAACLAGIVWAFNNPTRGVIFPEEVGEDYAQVWEDTRRYMGYVESKEVPWELVADLDVKPKIGSPTRFFV
jgi:homospermidine synthase